MLGLIYLALAITLGDQLCRRFYRFVSSYHRWAAGTLVGLLISTWITYLLGLALAATSKPLFWANLLFLLISVSAIVFLRHRSKAVVFMQPGTAESKWDWVALAIYLVIASWLMFASLGYRDGKLQVANNEWSDFGPNTAIARSFSVGHNFPTQYPHFSGEPIRYHFLFYFQAGNLEFLGLNLAWSINLLSIISLLSMLALVMSLGPVLFNSRAVGRIGAALFFFHGTLSVIPFFRSQESLVQAWHTIVSLKDFLPSGYPYRGELWGIWTQIVFVNQRHLASAIGILTIVLIFLVDRYRQHPASSEVSVSTQDQSTTLPLGQVEPAALSVKEETATQPPKAFTVDLGRFMKRLLVWSPSFVFSGLLLGALPLWNALVFTASAAILFCLFLLFPCRPSMVGLALTAAAGSLPQLIGLHSSDQTEPSFSLLHWGYVIEKPTVAKVMEYVGFIFGAKWPLIILALIVLSWFHRRFFLAISSLFLLTFFTQLSIEGLANHKFLNIWLVLANLFVAYGFCWLWRNRGSLILAISGRVLAVAYAIPILVGGIIDLFPIHNGYFVEIAYQHDPLVQWLLANTKPHDVFLTDRFVNHQILLAGRRIFYGWPSYPWSAGYDTSKRDVVYRELFESRDPRRVYSLLRANHIAYVAFDSGVRHGEFIKRPNEELYKRNFPIVFEDRRSKYYGLSIYKVPENLTPQAYQVDAGDMFVGGKGTGYGEFDFPRGLAVDRAGNILVSDTNNNRIQKFTSEGTSLGAIGRPGSDNGEFSGPDGLAVDPEGNIYVADTGNQRIQKLSPNGIFLSQWKGPPPGFYGPRDIVLGPDNSVYVVDQGNGRIVKLDKSGNLLAVWGSSGKGDGQFIEPSSVAVDGKNDRVYVADPRNERIQVFDTKGSFIAKWLVKEWQPNPWLLQHVVLDSKRARLYASSLATDEVLIFDLQGNKVGSLRPKPPDKLEGASAMALVGNKLYVLCTFANRVTEIEFTPEFGQPAGRN